MCMDFRDLNKESPKDDFPVPHIDILVDNITGDALLSFMDEYAGYNEVKMAMKEMEKTTFITQWGTYCYTVMLFGLKNAKATYQRTSTSLLYGLIHKKEAVYLDDIIIKSKQRDVHVSTLWKYFIRLRKYNMCFNLQKCAFGVTSGKIQGYVVNLRGIEVNLLKK